MDKTNQIFNCRRFAAALRKEAVENRTLLLLAPVAIYLWLLFRLTTENIFNKDIYAVNGGTFTVIAAILASMSFSQLRKKTRRMNLLITPTSTAEKYLVNLVLYVIPSFILFAVCLELADITRWAILSPFKTENFYVPAPNGLVKTLKMWKELTSFFGVSSLFEFFGVGCWFFVGSLLWPRHAFWKTAAAVFVLYLLKMFAGIASSNDYLNPVVNEESINLTLDIILFMGCWIAAWYLLKHKDLISRKWWK